MSVPNRVSILFLTFLQVYPLESIIPEVELDTISLEMTSGSSLPFKRSTWINTHIQRRRTSKPTKTERRELYVLF